MTTVHVAIGNSDDRLTQKRWSLYVSRVDALVRGWSKDVHGTWHSPPAAAWQSAAWTFDLDDPAARQDMRARLSMIARRFEQDSIAWLEGDTTFIPAEPHRERMGDRMLTIHPGGQIHVSGRGQLEPEPTEQTCTLLCEYGRTESGERCDERFVWAGPATDSRDARRQAHARARQFGWRITTEHGGRTRIICPGKGADL